MDVKLILKIFEGFSIDRWSDFIHPVELVEMDKSAEKMAIAYILGKFEEKNDRKVNWTWMIYASFFELLKKIALCDIKSPVQRMIRKNYPKEYEQLNLWILAQYRDLISDKDLFCQFEAYIKTDFEKLDEATSLAAKILRAAHKYSSLRELNLLQRLNEPHSLQSAEISLNKDLSEFLHLTGLQLFLTRQKPFQFLQMLEKLRYQIRWNQTPRVPKTSVLGHCFFVAILTLLFERQTGKNFCEKRIFNNFFCSLFHDLPEAVTRDIISPVKQATRNLPDVVKRIETEFVAAEILPSVDEYFKNEILYFIDDEFENRILVKGKMEKVTFGDLNEKYNSDEFSPLDGELIRLADHTAAFLEATSSIKYGITSAQLQEGRENLRKIYAEKGIVSGIKTDFFNLF